MRGAGAIGTALVAVVLLLGCAGPHVAPEKPVWGDRRYYAFETIEARDRWLHARNPVGAASMYAPDAEVVDVDDGAVLFRGREAIRGELDRFLRRCPELTIEVLKRRYANHGRFVSDLERVHCSGTPSDPQWVKYEVSTSDLQIVRVWTRRSLLGC